ncbi:MAG: hypothetical protein ACQESH_05130 [Campylobacterota bacterium]
MLVNSTVHNPYIYEAKAANRSTIASQTAHEMPNATSSKLDRMQEKYKDVYTPLPQTYSKADEDLQTQKIMQAYPDYVDFKEFLKIVDSYLEGPKIQLGQDLTPSELKDQKEDYNQAYEKAYEKVGGEEAFLQMQKDVQKIQQEYPINSWAKDGLENAKEMSRFYNAAVYEGLESAMSVEDAKRSASSAIFSYMGTSSTKTMLRALPNKELGIEGSDLFFQYVTYEKQNYDHDKNLDLRKYDIEGWWRDNEVYQSDNAMAAEIQKKISQFNFMLENPTIIQSALDRLDADSRPKIETLHDTIRNEELPQAKLALKVFENYDIYDSLDLRA